MWPRCISKFIKVGRLQVHNRVSHHLFRERFESQNGVNCPLGVRTFEASVGKQIVPNSSSKSHSAQACAICVGTLTRYTSRSVLSKSRSGWLGGSVSMTNGDETDAALQVQARCPPHDL
jgi:hypothetical protein